MSGMFQGPGRGPTPGLPRWMKVFILVFIALVLLVIILHLMGFGFGDHAMLRGMQSLIP